jgi:hypothetical protein
MYDAFGFTMALDSGSSFAAANLATGGFAATDTEASIAQGALTFTYKGANILLYWQPAEQQTPQGLVASNYQSLANSQPSVTFLAISEGEILVSEETGWYGGFIASDTTSDSTGGGLIGAWICSESSTAFLLEATGPDATSLQIRFDRVTSGFSCR